jgi:hypothetical protein
MYFDKNIKHVQQITIPIKTVALIFVQIIILIQL